MPSPTYSSKDSLHKFADRIAKLVFSLFVLAPSVKTWLHRTPIVEYFYTVETPLEKSVESRHIYPHVSLAKLSHVPNIVTMTRTLSYLAQTYVSWRQQTQQCYKWPSLPAAPKWIEISCSPSPFVSVSVSVSISVCHPQVFALRYPLLAVMKSHATWPLHSVNAWLSVLPPSEYAEKVRNQSNALVD